MASFVTRRIKAIVLAVILVAIIIGAYVYRQSPIWQQQSLTTNSNTENGNFGQLEINQTSLLPFPYDLPYDQAYLYQEMASVNLRAAVRTGDLSQYRLGSAIVADHATHTNGSFIEFQLGKTSVEVGVSIQNRTNPLLLISFLGIPGHPLTSACELWGPL